MHTVKIIRGYSKEKNIYIVEYEGIAETLDFKLLKAYLTLATRIKSVSDFKKAILF